MDVASFISPGPFVTANAVSRCYQMFALYDKNPDLSGWERRRQIKWTLQSLSELISVNVFKPGLEASH